MSKPSSNKHSTSTLIHDEVVISIASSSSSSPSKLKRNINVNKFWKALKQNLRSYCSWGSCFKPVVVSKIKRSNSTSTFKSSSMKTTSMNATGSYYSNKSADERDQMIKEAILYCKNSMNQVSVVDLEAFEIDHSNESVSKEDSKIFVDEEGIVMLRRSTDQEQVLAAATMVTDPSAVDVLQEAEEEEEEEVLDVVELPLDEEIEELLVRDTFANEEEEEEEEPCLGKESEQLRSSLPISATAPTLFRKKDLLIEKLEKEIKELIRQRDLAQSRLNDLLQEVDGDSRLWADFDPTNKSNPAKAWESENSRNVSRFTTYPLSNEDTENHHHHRCCDDYFMFDGTSLQISMGIGIP